MRKPGQFAIIAVTFVLALGCGSDDAGNEGSCTPGELNCGCNMGVCLAGLLCENNVCLDVPGDGDSGDGDGDSGDGDGTPGDGDGTPGDGDGTPGDGDGTPGDGDGTPGDGDGDSCGAGEMLCNGMCVDTANDDSNCGSCGKVCDVTGQFGGCNGGVCEPALSECVLAGDPVKSCEQVCGEIGKSCVFQGCGGVTYYGYELPNACDEFLGDPNIGDCSGPAGQTPLLYRCCCQ